MSSVVLASYFPPRATFNLSFFSSLQLFSRFIFRFVSVRNYRKLQLYFHFRQLWIYSSYLSGCFELQNYATGLRATILLEKVLFMIASDTLGACSKASQHLLRKNDLKSRWWDEPVDVNFRLAVLWGARTGRTQDGASASSSAGVHLNGTVLPERWVHKSHVLPRARWKMSSCTALSVV